MKSGLLKLLCCGNKWALVFGILLGLAIIFIKEYLFWVHELTFSLYIDAMIWLRRRVWFYAWKHLLLSGVLWYCARFWVLQLTVHSVFSSGVDFVQYDLAILTEWSRKYFWGNTELPFFSPTERELLQGVLLVSENSSCPTVIVQVLVSFLCSFSENLSFAILHECLRTLLIVHVV